MRSCAAETVIVNHIITVHWDGGGGVGEGGGGEGRPYDGIFETTQVDSNGIREASVSGEGSERDG